jgi:uncharacterized protein with HEPN domain
MKRTYLDFIEDIYEAIINVERFTDGLAYEAFVSDEKTLYAVRTGLQIIGEASAKIPERIRAQHPDIPWRQIISFRNRIVHEYFGLDVRLIWATIQHDLPELKPKIEQLLKTYKE